MISVRLRRVKLHKSGTRIVHVGYHHELDMWAQCHNTEIRHHIDPNDESWVCIEFLEDKFATLFLLTYEHDLGIEPCI